MKKYKSLVLLVVVLICSFEPAHKFYFSITSIKVNNGNKSAAISCKLFTEDLEEILYLKTKVKFDLSKSLATFAKVAYTYKYMEEIEGTARLLRNQLTESKEIETNIFGEVTYKDNKEIQWYTNLITG
jgi:hypothetical protein